MLAIEGLKKRYGDVTALDGIDLTVEPGEIVALLGPNGAGKTTLVSITAGLRRADDGSVRVGEIDARARPDDARRLIGLAPQDLGIYPIIKVRDNFTLFGEIGGLSKQQLAQRTERVAEALGLTDMLDRIAGTLSGGEKRRLHTALALLHSPPLLLLDEATTGADVRTRGDILEVVRQLAQDGTAILYSTHYMPEVETLGASVAIIEQGRLIARGPLEQLIRAHGQNAVELMFDGPAPTVSGAHVEDGLVRIVTDDPGAAIAQALAALPTEAPKLLGVEVIRPNLESVYLSLTGKRYEGESEAITKEPSHVG